MKRRGRTWTDDEIATAFKLRDGGLNTEEIGRAMDRTEPGVRDMFYRRQPNEVRRRDGEPIGETKEDRRFANDARKGSAKLKSEIERVFGQQRMAA